MTDQTAAPVAAASLEEYRPPRNQWWDVWDQFKTHKGALFGLGFFILALLFVFIGPLIWSIDPQYIDIRPSHGHGPIGPGYDGADDGGRPDLDRGGSDGDAAGAGPWHADRGAGGVFQTP